MTEQCVVKKLRRGYAYIELKHSDRCDGCKICSFNSKKAIVVPAVCDIKVSPGDRVSVEMPTRSVGAAALLIYAIPLLLMVVGALIGFAGDVYLQAGLAGAGLVIGLACAFIIDRIYRKKAGVLPVVTALLTEKEPACTPTEDIDARE